jgi:uncharacterized protein (TIGR03083 family)
MDETAYLAAILEEGRAFSGAARQGLEAPVRSCPGWNVRQLVIHLGNVHEFVGEIVRQRARDEATADAIHERLLEGRARRREDPWFAIDDNLLAWFDNGLTPLLTALAGAGPQEPVWTWFAPQQNAGFWQRRMAHETAVHRWDAQVASGLPEPVDAELARDGIDEALRVHARERMRESETTGAGETYHYHCTDGPGEWLVRLEGEPIITDEHSKADVAMRSSASNLLLFLWQRLPVAEIEVFGDASLLDRWFSIIPPE